MNGTLRTADGRCVLRFERRLRHPIGKVWRAITDPDELKHWFPAEIKADWRLGGELFWVWGGDEPDTPGTITEYEPPYRWAHVADDETMRFELTPDGDGCLLVFTHIFDDRAGAASFATGWHWCLDLLEARLAGLTADRSGGWRKDRYEAYVEAFGLLEGTVEEAAGDVLVCFELQFTEPVDALWSALTAAEGTDPGVGGSPPRGCLNASVPAGEVTEFSRDWPVETKWGTTGILLEYIARRDGRDAGRVRWELSAGPGGARLSLTQTVPGEPRERQATALAGWHRHLELLAEGRYAEDPDQADERRIRELVEHYSGR